MKKKDLIILLSVLGVGLILIIIAVVAFFVWANNVANPLDLSSDFAFIDAEEDDELGLVYTYKYKEYTEVNIIFDEKQKVKSIYVSSDSYHNPNYAIDNQDRLDAIRYLLNKDLFYFTADEKTQIMAHVHNNNSFEIRNMHIGVIIDANNFLVVIRPSEN